MLRRRGYDVIEFAQHGCTATGLEISKSAVGHSLAEQAVLGQYFV